jgi:hypothetical protein
MKLNSVKMINGATLKMGPGTERSSFANEGQGHVEMVGEHWVAIWDDRHPEGAAMVPRERVQEVRLHADEIKALLARFAADAATPDGERKRATAPTK